MDEQKKRELKSLNKLLDLIDFKFSQKIIPEESPDFLINSDNKTLGIEVVEIFQAPPDDGVYLQQQESIKENILEKTETKLKDIGVPPIDVYVNFNDHFRLNIDTSQFVLEKDDQYSFPQILVDIITDNIPETDEEIEIYGVDCKKIPIKINSVKITRAEYLKDIIVSTAKGGILPPLDKQTLRQSIDAKNQKIELYKKKCDECWLLISSNDLQFEKAFDLENSKHALQSCYEFEFEKVYFLEEAFEKVFEIKLCT